MALKKAHEIFEGDILVIPGFWPGWPSKKARVDSDPRRGNHYGLWIVPVVYEGETEVYDHLMSDYMHGGREVEVLA